MYLNNNDFIYFDRFGLEHIPKKIKAFVNNKNIKTNIFRMQAYDSIICGYFCIGFIEFVVVGKTLTEFTNLFFHQINLRKMVLNYFMSNI